jgi:dTDP-4-dehydrorhamnose reductase
MIFLIGATGYVGGAFARELARRELEFKAVSRRDVDCTHFGALLEALKAQKPEFVINAAGFTGKPNVDACETQRGETILGNIVLPQTVAEACAASGTRLGTVSSGCIYTGAKFADENGVKTIESDLNAPGLQKPLQARSALVRGFTETDPANFSFAQDNCSFYSGTKAVAEQVLAQFPESYVWRLRIPFEEQDNARNYLSKIQRYPKVYQNWNSISHLGDFVSACLDTWQLGLPGGCYNIVNPGYVSTREVVELVRKFVRPDWQPEFWKDDAEFYRTIARTPRSNCLLDATKLVQAGVKIRSIDAALEETLENWLPAQQGTLT